MEPTGIILKSSESEIEEREKMLSCFLESPIPKGQLLQNIGLFIESKHLARILLLDFLFRKIIDVHGNVFEFGCRWGQNSAVFSALRGIYDPFNRHRKIVSFDTFEGFASVSNKDGSHEMMFDGALSTTENYEEYLKRIMKIHELLNPLSHIDKFEIRKGDANLEVGKYLNEHPETIISLAFFDFDLYEPTKSVLNIIRPRLVRGSVVAFDELNDPDAPGETLALMDAVGLGNVRLRKYPHASRVAYFVVD
jgi:hypothetical protein